MRATVLPEAESQSTVVNRLLGSKRVQSGDMRAMGQGYKTYSVVPSRRFWWQCTSATTHRILWLCSENLRSWYSSKKGSGVKHAASNCRP